MKESWIENKVVLITGSSQGIGKETALQFAAKGAKIVINGRTKSKLLAIEEEFVQLGYEVLAVAADITVQEECEQMIDEVVNKFGRLDVLINNGGLTMNEGIENLESNLFSSIFISNSMSSVYMTKAALPHLQKTKGSVVFISSIAGLHGLPSASAYSMGKMSLTAFWQSIQLELINSGIHFGICYLGFTENDAEKTMIQQKGNLTSVPDRPKYLVQSKQKVASNIIRLVKKRKKKKVFSALGKMSEFTFNHFPLTTLFLLRTISRKKQA